MDLREPLQQETVAHVGIRDLVSVDVGARVRDALAIMQEHAVGSIVVVAGEELRGVFTERDLLVRVLGAGKGLDVPLADVMTGRPTVARADEAIHLVLTRMYQGAHRHLPVVDDEGRPVGTISLKRVARFLGDHLPSAVYNLPPDPNRFPERAEGG